MFHALLLSSFIVIVCLFFVLLSQCAVVDGFRCVCQVVVVVVVGLLSIWDRIDIHWDTKNLY